MRRKGLVTAVSNTTFAFTLTLTSASKVELPCRAGLAYVTNTTSGEFPRRPLRQIREPSQVHYDFNISGSGTLAIPSSSLIHFDLSIVDKQCLSDLLQLHRRWPHPHPFRFALFSSRSPFQD
ncbi:hypothetical protein L6164_035279 [Bauhinia variegata]|uniref:Uncharacterized protein n=1 Tax=Bauhinia variegata TaxID=167791 RepID=A0ACB9KYH7_BAUVA|nr:hypothetical protein L6164_035279 [Bauhinia variegata]